MTDLTVDKGEDVPKLSAADEQSMHELTERARTGLKLTGEGGPLGKLAKMVIAESALDAISAMEA